MHKDRLLVSVVLVVLAIAAGSTALAQSTSTTQSPTPGATADQVKDWTLKKWNAMKRELRKDRAKWDTCNRQASDQKLTGKASWTFIYNCMKAS